LFLMGDRHLANSPTAESRAAAATKAAREFQEESQGALVGRQMRHLEDGIAYLLVFND
jgi:hypothetical protein